MDIETAELGTEPPVEKLRRRLGVPFGRLGDVERIATEILNSSIRHHNTRVQVELYNHQNVVMALPANVERLRQLFSGCGTISYDPKSRTVTYDPHNPSATRDAQQ